MKIRTTSRPSPMAWALAMAVGVSGWMLVGEVWAAQLGRLTVVSRPGEPLVAEIQVEQLTDEQREGLVARMADPAAFAAANMAMSPLLSQLSVALSPLGPDRAVIRLSSTLPIPASEQSRALDALVELSWAGGKLVREYNIPLPVMTPDAATEAATRLPATQMPAPEPAPKLDAKTEAVASPARAVSSEAPAGGGIRLSRPAEQAPPVYVVRRGDTLSSLADTLVPQADTPEQAMASIYLDNRSAFIGGSIHLIREGAVLTPPRALRVQTMSRPQAKQVLAQHDDRGLSQVARSAMQPGGLRQSGEAATVVGKISEATPVREQPSQVDQLKVGRKREGKEDVASQERANVMAEELVSKEKALKEANERIALLEKNVADLQKLLEMKSRLAQPAQAAAETKLPAKPSGDATAEAAKTEGQPADETGKPEVQNPPAVAEVADAAKAEEAKPAEPVASKDAVDDEDDALSEPVVPVKASPWWLRPAVMVGGGMGLAFGAGLAWLAVRRRGQRKTLAALSGIPMVTDPLMAAQAEAPVPTELPVRQLETPVPVVEEAAPAAPVDDGFTPIGDGFDSSMDFAQGGGGFEPLGSVSDLPDFPPSQVAADQDVKLDFPAEGLATGGSGSILDDLDMMAEQTEAASAAIADLRAEPSNESIDDTDFEAAMAAVEPAAEAVGEDPPNPPIDEATWQELATKLDLAAAYVEIGDADGARELLDEVVRVGDPDQVKQAKQMLAGMATA